MLIRCPWCGERGYSEFTYGADAQVSRPAATAPDRDWVDYVYIRDNPRGLHEEYWHHVQGCRQWLRVIRHTMTHEITKVTAAAAPAEPR
jgi:heterotetrameric sarcosine oxidase delta subunit